MLSFDGHLAERSKALRSGRSPKGRGFESHSVHDFLSFFAVNFDEVKDVSQSPPVL